MAAQAQQAQQKAEYFVAQIDKELEKYPHLVNFERSTGVPKAYAAIGTLSILTILIFFNIFAGFLTQLIGFAAPAYFSMKALESPQPQDDVQWLTYWVVFGAFTFAESFVNVILYWFPFYYTIKTLVVLYLMLPQTQGAKVVYARVLRPAFAQTRSAAHSTSAAPTTGATQ
ncbi:protein YOP1 [Microstroma glucosiphilum]|uniref:Protein YOP1 n=1 Tax=Pseudomicrostroma glucosiphilum TaxID=1684307 RepID=A0A316UA64_9BASI|nr:protein YOP1 [Pseudomicrostroma glucosiphilum]PWN22096.1 protein YOP1 [Pseudomicrostroma glucosiphilum]